LGSLVTISPKDVSSNAPNDILTNRWDNALNGTNGNLHREEVRLAHFSVKEYLLSDRIQSGSASEFGITSIEPDRSISESCLLYILHYDKSDSKTRSYKDLKMYPLLPYACQFWYTHANRIHEGSRKAIDPITFELFLSDSALMASLQVHRPDTEIQSPFTFMAYFASLLYYASCIGLEAVVRLLLERKADVNAKDYSG
jgi:hypothetical protein